MESLVDSDMYNYIESAIKVLFIRSKFGILKDRLFS